jgi:hypothetical protein
LFYNDAPPFERRFDIEGEEVVQHDPLLRASARAIYDSCYPSEDWAPVGFDEAERAGTIHYRQAVDAALQARGIFAARGEQLPLFAAA